MFLSPLLRGEYPPDAAGFYAGIADFDFVRPGDLELIGAPIDFLGINFYEQHLVAADSGAHPPDGNITRGTRKLAPQPPVTGGNVGIRPEGLYNVLTRVHRKSSDRPLWMNENGLALHDYAGPDGRCHDPERIEYFAQHFDAAARAIADGVPLEAYLVWSLMDNFEWADGYSKRFGIVYVDYPTQTRIPKSSAQWLRRVIAATAVVPGDALG